MYDITIIGAGVIGTMIARELSRYQLKVLLIDKEEDVSCGASKANSGIIHGGYDAKHGTMKAKFSRVGNRMYAQLEKELNFGYRECGSLVMAYSQEDFENQKQSLQNLGLHICYILLLVSHCQHPSPHP